MKRKLMNFWYTIHQKYLIKLKLIIAGIIHKKRKGVYCWADCVGFAYNPRRLNPFKIEKSNPCCEESKTHTTKMCYCSGWSNGVCYDLLSKEEKQKIKERVDNESPEQTNRIPF